ncbi:D(2) dopamine receptor-like [Stylophora pistillata]|uniref:D(2) dopamine receptor-like n=1 Tax=Stylophora pistillata TaxID=50429 RepID=UPI000C048C87|nr:D(2) dopamine receptor-like [Stylophora pistillata]
MVYFSASQCIPWLVVLIIECLAIIILNIITIVVFVKKKRQLQRRSTYLIIHLAIVDLSAGAVSEPLQIEDSMAKFCNLWKYRSEINWLYHIKLAFRHLFSFASLGNLVVIALERLHATFFPFRHRFIEKWVYRVTIIVVWLTSTTREVAQIVLSEESQDGNKKLANKILYFPVYIFAIFIICVSYSLIAIKVRCRRHPQFHLAAKIERKLTGTSLIVSLASLLCFLPAVTYLSIFYFLRPLKSFHFHMAALFTFLANSLINPAIYASRMPGFRAGLLQIFFGAPNLLKAPVNLPLCKLRAVASTRQDEAIALS